MEGVFRVERVLEMLDVLNASIEEQREVPFAPFISLLEEFCVLFRQCGRILSMAFSDVQEKIDIFRQNNLRFPDQAGFIAFVSMEMQLGVHKLNGENNKKERAPKEFKAYNSTARNLLRMMWFLTFVSVTFGELEKDPVKSLSVVFNQAYDAAFGAKHSFLVRQAAKLAMKAGYSRENLERYIRGTQQATNEELLRKFNGKLAPLYGFLWGFYRERQLEDLE